MPALPKDLPAGLRSVPFAGPDGSARQASLLPRRLSDWGRREMRTFCRHRHPEVRSRACGEPRRILRVCGSAIFGRTTRGRAHLPSERKRARAIAGEDLNAEDISRRSSPQKRGPALLLFCRSIG